MFQRVVDLIHCMRIEVSLEVELGWDQRKGRWREEEHGEGGLVS